MSGVQIITVNEGEAGMRLDRWFRQHFPAVSHGALEKYLRKGEVRVNGKRAKSAHRLETGQDVRIPPLPDNATEPALPRKPEKSRTQRARDRTELEAMRLYEDDALLILNKPHGLAVQGGTNTKRFIDGMLEAWGTGDDRPRLVHRLDRDTGGVLVLAKSRKAAASLGFAFQKHEIDKTYWALTAGVPMPREGTIDLPLAKKSVPGPGKRSLEKVVAGAEGDTKYALTDFQTVAIAGAVTFLALRPRTGRTHQLRAHCAAMGTPIVGDAKYGGQAAKLEGLSAKLHLTCQSMRFRHPATGKPFEIAAPLSGHMDAAWRFFDFDRQPEIGWPDDKGEPRI